MIILQIETATSVCSVALSRAGETIAKVELDEPNVHASKLTRLIEQVMQAAALQLSDLNGIAVSKGPGSYTGLRIGVSTAKGLCYGLEIPLIGIDSLYALANGFLRSNIVPENSLIYPMIDARRLEVYTAVFTSDLELRQTTKAQIIDSTYFNQIPSNQPVVLFGDGADKFKEMFVERKNVQVVPAFKQSAAYLSKLAYQAFQESKFEDIAYFEPFYLKDFIPLKKLRNNKSLL